VREREIERMRETERGGEEEGSERKKGRGERNSKNVHKVLNDIKNNYQHKK
jgi:hypothetical protein